MDLITGKAKEAFEKWLLTDGNEVIKNGTIEYDLYYMCKYMIPSNMVYSKIIDWLDSVNICVGVTHDVDGDHSDFTTVVNTSFVGFYQNRHKATKEAIKKAVEIYNKGAS